MRIIYYEEQKFTPEIPHHQPAYQQEYKHPAWNPIQRPPQANHNHPQ